MALSGTAPGRGAAPELTIGAAAKASGVHIETIRYYERAGLLPDPPRTASGHRRYGPDHLKRLYFVRRGRELGFSLDEIRALLGLADGGDDSCARVRALTLEHLQTTRRKIADLTTLAGVLETMAAKCDSGDVPDCPVIDALFTPE